jgi:NAD(P)-dependent dehydrogenase (short-subunit alcohol dehydrogenase family)
MVAERKQAVVVGGSAGIGLATAKALAQRGEAVVVTSRDKGRAEGAARQVGGDAHGIAVDLAAPDQIAASLAEVERVDHLVIGAIEPDRNTAKGFAIPSALKITTTKLVGYIEAIHALLPRFAADGSIVLMGGQAREFPYPGGVTVATVNGGITTMVRALAMELGPIRVNAVHPGMVVDSPRWAGADEVTRRVLSRTPSGRLATLADCAGAILFLLDNPAVNGANLVVDGGFGVGLGG